MVRIAPSLAVLATGATLAFLWLIAPFAGAILWAVIAAVVFAPVQAAMLRAMPAHRTGAALATLAVIVAAVIVPTILLASALIDEASGVYAGLINGTIQPGRWFTETSMHLPRWARHWLAGVGLGDPAGVQRRVAAWLAASFQTLAGQAFTMGQSAFGLFVALGVMLYLTFFLLRDGVQIAARVVAAIPLPPAQVQALVAKFVAVIRATIKGSLVVAILQGTIGGLTFWALGLHGALLWGVAMGVFSLFPAVGTGLIWVPVALYLLATGAFWQGAALALCGVFVISTVDNIVRPILVGRDARMPDYVVLIATLGGFELLGFNGFVVGPVIAALFMAIWGIVANDRAGASPARRPAA